MLLESRTAGRMKIYFKMEEADDADRGYSRVLDAFYAPAPAPAPAPGKSRQDLRGATVKTRKQQIRTETSINEFESVYDRLIKCSRMMF